MPLMQKSANFMPAGNILIVVQKNCLYFCHEIIFHDKNINKTFFDGFPNEICIKTWKKTRFYLDFLGVS